MRILQDVDELCKVQPRLVVPLAFVAFCSLTLLLAL